MIIDQNIVEISRLFDFMRRSENKLLLKVMLQPVDVGSSSLQSTLQVSKSAIVPCSLDQIGNDAPEVSFALCHLFLHQIFKMGIFLGNLYLFDAPFFDIFQTEGHPVELIWHLLFLKQMGCGHQLGKTAWPSSKSFWYYRFTLFLIVLIKKGETLASQS